VILDELVEEVRHATLRHGVAATLDEVGRLVGGDNLRDLDHRVLIDLVRRALLLLAAVSLDDGVDGDRNHVATVRILSAVFLQALDRTLAVLEELLGGDRRLIEAVRVVLVADVLAEDAAHRDAVEHAIVLAEAGAFSSIHLAPGTGRDVLAVLTELLGRLVHPDTVADEALDVGVPVLLLHELHERERVVLDFEFFEAVLKRRIHRVHVVLGRVRVDARSDHPAGRKGVVVNLAVREELHEAVHDARRAAVRFLEEDETAAARRPELRESVARAFDAVGILARLGEPDQVGSFEIRDAEVEKPELGVDFTLLADPLLNDLRLAETGVAREHRVDDFTDLVGLLCEIEHCIDIRWLHLS